MGVRLNRWVGTLVGTVAVTTALGSLGSDVSAQETTPGRANRPVAPQTAFEVLEDAFFRSSGDFYDNDSVFRELSIITGPYPENNITTDAARVNRVYNQLLVQQSQLDPTIRTADLENPFTASLLTLPTTAQATPSAPPLVPPPVFAPQVPPVPAPSAPQRNVPVRALY